MLHDPFSLLVPVRKMFSELSNYSLTLPDEKSLFLQFSWLLEIEVSFVSFLTRAMRPTCSAVIILFYYSPQFWHLFKMM